MEKITASHKQFLHSFDGLRVVAATLVLLQHETFLAKKYLGLHFAGGLFSLGDFRIDLFFILSGFFAAWRGGRRHEFRPLGLQFLGWRLCRLLPLLWVLTTVKLASMRAFDIFGRHEGLDWFQILRSYTLLPAPGYPVILPAWTLSFELVFCVIWSVLLCFSRRITLTALGLWAAAILIYGAAYVTPSRWLPGFALHPYFLDFIAGILLAETAPYRKPRISGSAVMLAGAALLIVAITAEPMLKAYPEVVRRIVWGGGSFLIVTGLLYWERTKVAFVMPGGLRLVAKCSYAIYLTHSLVLFGVLYLMKDRWANSQLISLYLVFLAVGTLGVGILVHRWLEAPLQRALQWYLNSLRSAKRQDRAGENEIAQNAAKKASRR